MNVSAEERIRRALADLRDTAPEVTHPILEPVSTRHADHGRRSWLAIAAAVIIITGGATGIIVVRSTTSNSPRTDPTAAATADTNPVNPTPAASGFLAPSALPDGYVLYPDDLRDGTYLNPEAAWLVVEVVVGPANATPNDIVDVVAGATVGGTQCGSTDSGEGLDPPGVMVGEALAAFCNDPYAPRQLTWTADGTPVMLLAGSAVDDDQLLTIARGVVVPPGIGLDQQVSSEDIAVTALPDGWVRLGSSDPLAATEYQIGSATEQFAPTFTVSIYADTEPTDIWAIMNGRFTSTPVTVRGTTGYLDNGADHNPFLVWQEADGLIVRIQNSGGDVDSILAFAESLVPLDADQQQAFLEAAQPRPRHDSPTVGMVSTTSTTPSTT